MITTIVSGYDAVIKFREQVKSKKTELQNSTVRLRTEPEKVIEVIQAEISEFVTSLGAVFSVDIADEVTKILAKDPKDFSTVYRYQFFELLNKSIRYQRIPTGVNIIKLGDALQCIYGQKNKEIIPRNITTGRRDHNITQVSPILYGTAEGLEKLLGQYVTIKPASILYLNFNPDKNT
jgi:hypothetical protein